MVYEKVKELCKQNRITISVLEKELGFGTGTICKWKKCSPKFSNMIAVAKYFRVSLDYFVTENK